jgi:amidase
MEVFKADGGEDIAKQCAISGEPVLGGVLKDVKPTPLSAYQFWQLTYARRLLITRQLQAWQATAALTGTGRPVDAVIAPISPYPSFKHGDQEYVFYTVRRSLLRGL